MAEFLERYSQFVARHGWLVLAVTLLGTLALSLGISRLEVNLDPQNQLPADNPYITVDRKIRAEFGGKNFVAIALVPRSGTVWRPDVLRAVHDLTLDLLNAPGIIRQNVVSLSSPYVRAVRDRGGALFADSLMKEAPADEAGIRALRDLYESEPLVKGTVVSDDERAALVLVDFYDDRKETEIAATVNRAIAKYRSDDIRIAVTGSPILSDMETTLVGQQRFYFLGTVSAIVLVLYLAFGQLQGIVLPITTALLSTVCAMGFMGFAGIPLNPWTTSVPLVVVTVAAGHSAQMLKRYYEEFARLGDRRAAVVEATKKIGLVMMAAGATASAGFAALSVLRIPTLTQFGLGVASGFLAAVILEMTFMLALRALWPTGRTPGREGPLARWLEIFLQPLETAVLKHPRWIAVGFLGVAVVAAAGIPRLRTDFNAQDYWSEKTEIGRDLRVFQEHFPSTTTMTVLLEGEPGSMKTPEAIRVMTDIQRVLAEDPEVGRTSSIADIIRRTYEVFAPEEAGHDLPADVNLISQLFFLADSPAFERYVDRTYSRSVVFGFLNRENSGLTSRAIKRVENLLRENPPAGIRVSLAGGVGPTLLALNEHTVKGKVLNITIVLAVIFAIASVLLRTASGGACVVMPLVMVLIVNLGVFAWSGLAFDLAGASVAAVGVGIGADYAIYFLYRLREEFRRSRNLDIAVRDAMRTSGRAVLFVALAISAGFAVYLISDYYPLRICGLFVPLTMVVSSFTAVTLLPAVVLITRPRFIFAPERTAVRPFACEEERISCAGGAR